MSLKKLFLETLAKDRPKDPTYVPGFKIKPSVIGSPCMRKIYYASAGMDPDYGFDLSGKLRMKMGDAIEEMYVGVIRESGKLVEYHNPDGTIPRDFKGKNSDGTVIWGDENRQFPISFPELFIKSGKIDIVVIIDGKLWIGEVKSINQKGFSGLMQPKPDHMIQGCSYYYIFNEHLKAGKYAHIKALEGFQKAEGVMYQYVNKDTTEVKEYVTTEQDEFFTQIVNKIIAVKEAYDTKTLPPKTPDFCGTCQYRDSCRKNRNI